MFFGCTVFEKNAILTYKNSKLQNCPDFEFLQVSIASFSNTVQMKNIKTFSYKVYRKVNIYTKFHVLRLHSIREKCDAKFQKFKVAELSK